ncbi:MAG: hypothetical protein ACOY45_13670 [Pseudomonadota bacterium]
MRDRDLADAFDLADRGGAGVQAMVGMEDQHRLPPRPVPGQVADRHAARRMDAFAAYQHGHVAARA